LKNHLIIVLVFIPWISEAQSFKVNLSPRHQEKLTNIQSGHKRMGKYYKYVKKDSARTVKRINQKARQQSDSTFQAEAMGRKIESELQARGLTTRGQVAYADSLKREHQHWKLVLRDSTTSDSVKEVARKRVKEMSKNRTNKYLLAHDHPYKKNLAEADSLQGELSRWWRLWKDTSATDSTRKVARQKVRELTVARARKNLRFTSLEQKFLKEGGNWQTLREQMPEMDSLESAFDSSPDTFFAMAEEKASSELLHQAGLGVWQQQTREFAGLKSQISGWQNKDSLEAAGKAKLKEEAIDHLASHADKLTGAQQKLSKLLNKYKEFSNSNDLSDAVKRTSLKGATWKERLVLGGNFNVVSTEPLSLDFSPLIGYKLNTKFYMGVGMNYRQTFGDSIRYVWKLSPSNTSYRLLANYDIIKNFFLYAEWERAGTKILVNDTRVKRWVNNYFIGAGKKLLIHPKLYMTLTALYNLNNEKFNPTYPRRFQFRLGFQTSDLAFRKKKIHYRR
jgi:hypothetical protein